jgi:hypothetical protein
MMPTGVRRRLKTKSFAEGKRQQKGQGKFREKFLLSFLSLNF